MYYVLRQRILNSSADFPISQEKFDEIARARVVAHQALALEEKYYMLLQNYFDLERVIHDLALSDLLFPALRWSDYVDKIHAVNRQILNLLSAAKAYIDQVPQHLNSIFMPSKAESEMFVSMTNAEFDANFGYRIMCALRNHAQHGDFPVQSLELGSIWTRNEDQRLCRSGATAFIHLDALRYNPKVRAKTRLELESYGEKLDLKPLVRQYMSSFSRLHIFVRGMIFEVAGKSEQLIREVHNDFCKRVEVKPSALAAMSVNEENMVIEVHAVFLDGLDRWRHLLQRSSTIVNLDLHCVSGEA